MYRIKNLNGEEIATVDRIQFVKEERNGAIILCEGPKAQGIVADDILYHLIGLPPFGDRQTVTYEEFSGKDYEAVIDELCDYIAEESV